MRRSANQSGLGRPRNRADTGRAPTGSRGSRLAASYAASTDRTSGIKGFGHEAAAEAAEPAAAIGAGAQGVGAFCG